MPIRLGLLIAALLLGTLLIWLILHAIRNAANEPNRLLFWLILTLLWGLWAWRVIEYHREK